MALFVELSLLIIFGYFVLKLKFEKFVAQFKNIPRDPVPFLLGSTIYFIFKSPSEIFEFGMARLKQLGGTALFVIGFTARIFITDPKDVEEILTNRKLTAKADFYVFIKNWLGTGLLLSDGQLWHSRRKVISKSFHFQILEEFVEIFDKNSSVFVKKFERLENKAAIDVIPMIGLCTLDVICETSMGVEIRAQFNSESEYVKAVKQISEIVAKRFFSILLQNPWLFKLSPLYWKQKKCLKVLHDFTDSVIVARRNELVSKSNQNGDQPSKRKLALLDVLLHSTIDGQPLSNMDIREEVDTFMFEGHDTTTSAIAFCLYELARNPQVQRKACDEIKNVIGDDVNKAITLKDLNDLQYLELVIKETLRLFPSVPMYGRVVTEDMTLNGKFIPKNTNLLITACLMGRLETIWENPEEFRPERFLAENLVNSNPFAYVPFSAGSRNCIGQKFAMLEMKSIVSKVLRNFELSLPDKFKPILIAEMIIRSENGLMIKFDRRVNV